MKKEFSRSFYGQKIKQSNMVFEYRYYLTDEEGSILHDDFEFSDRVFTLENIISIEDAIKQCKASECNNIELYCWVNDDNEDEITQLWCDVCNLEEDGIQWIYDLHTSHVVLSSSINVAMPSKILKDWNQAKNK